MSDTDSEYRALRESCGLLDRSPVSRLEMSGADRTRFLNGFLTCDVKSLEPGGGTYGFVTQVKGRILADVKVLVLADVLWLELPPGTGDEVAAHLGKYVIVDQVEIRRLDEAPLSLVGPRASEVLAGIELPEAPLGHCSSEIGGIEVRLVREAVESMWTLWTSAEGFSALWDELGGRGACPVGRKAWEQLRVEEGRPLYGQDFGIDNFPQETGLEDAVSYTKGCYLGQEVVARIHYRGGVNKLLRGLRFTDVAEPLGKPVLHDGRDAGTVTSVAHSPDYGHIGLAILHKRVEPGAPVEIVGAGSAEVVTLPFAPLRR